MTLVVTDEQRSELSKWAAPRTARRRRFPRAADVGAGRGNLASNHRADHIAVETEVRTGWLGRTRPAAQRQPAARGPRGGASPDCAPNPTETSGRIDALVLPQDGADAKAEQIHRAAGVSANAIEAAPAGQLHGVRRSTFRRKSHRHHWPVPESAAARGGLLRR